MLNRVNAAFPSLEYLTGMTFSDYYRTAVTSHPDLCDLLDEDAITGDRLDDYLRVMNSLSWEFEDLADGGRGAAYNVAQKVVGNRQQGMVALLKCFSPSFRDMPDADTKILDVLGGDGTIARFVHSLDGPRPTIFTADLSRFMVDACMRQGLPCVRQSATRSLFKDNSLDGVLIAYGSHHLADDDRQLAISEAYRTLKPGGRLVLHDFETGGETARWFEEVVHVYSRTGHPHPHFTRPEMWERFSAAGFRDVRVFDLNDPFTLPGATADEAVSNALMHMYHMYDLVKIANGSGDITNRVARCVEQTLGEIHVNKAEDDFVATIPRKALVAVGTKS
ncbi:SAM-dependent methyltransferase [Rhizobium sp. BK316]|uniref:class I SAM-dependent methyltransferase n=1 Tax=Rhizobium sp. BK316 TaxID=2587053 RepID=UPI00160ACA25|nr:class I SAM-dependent methyltransferase [Rhizobium sp. BK316]MBB3411929.1 SAM-dependent methyltransferase [Rhizobium sp. BK316]